MKRPRRAILGCKIGMSQMYDDNNVLQSVTLVEAGPCTVLQVKTKDTDGYEAFQVGFGDRTKRVRKPQEGLYKKVGTAPKKYVVEIPRLADAEWNVGDQVEVSVLEGVAKVDVSGVSKGKGFQGNIRRWNHSIGPKSHGSKSKRNPGSIGMHQDPGRVIKGKKMPGHMGAANVKVRNLRVLGIDAEKNLLLIRGAIPGAVGGYVYIEESLSSLESDRKS